MFAWFGRLRRIIDPTASFNQSRLEKDLLRRLTKGFNRVKALELVLKAPDEYSGLILYFAANVAHKKKRVEDSAFLFYAGQLRVRFDTECFPPKSTGGNSPLLAYAAVSLKIGSTINPEVMAE